MRTTVDEDYIKALLQQQGLTIESFKYLDCGGQRIVYSAIINKEKCVVKLMDITPKNFDKLENLNEEELQLYNDSLEYYKECTMNEVNNNKKTEVLPSPLFFDPYFEFDFNNHNFLIIIEEFIEGETLSSISKKEAYSYLQALDFLEQLLVIVESLYQCDIVHRDLTPRNIVYDSKTKKYNIIDAGIAKDNKNPKSYTMTGVEFGTPVYRPPEMIRVPHNMKWDFRTDFYSIGMVAVTLIHKDLFPTLVRLNPEFDMIQVIREHWLDKDSSLIGKDFFNFLLKFILPDYFMRYSTIESAKQKLLQMREVVK